MEKYNYERLEEALRMYDDAEVRYFKATHETPQDDEEIWERENELGCMTDLLAQTVKEVLQCERDDVD